MTQRMRRTGNKGSTSPPLHCPLTASGRHTSEDPRFNSEWAMSGPHTTKQVLPPKVLFQSPQAEEMVWGHVLGIPSANMYRSALAECSDASKVPCASSASCESTSSFCPRCHPPTD